ncbi:sugar ABC transporter permease [Marinomonas sp. TI.3.20]|uniref:carbohydrate ABC transporter permease n=1 Tax=Marinomonas sp. TI.3.20 TaxID=3121296 RepID=UPI00311EF6D3
MKNKTFFAFVSPSIIIMLLFIAIPLVTVFVQSFYVTQTVYNTVSVETCTPSFPTSICTTSKKSVPVMDKDNNPVTKTVYIGFDTYKSVLETGKVAKLIASGHFFDIFTNIDFYKALSFTLLFTLITLPLVLGVGLLIALAVNNVSKRMKGPVIFVSLLPFIITPIIGALSIKWLFVSNGLLTRVLEKVTGHEISVFANSWSIELLMVFYRVWHVAPFAFVLFYAGLQSVNKDTLESAIIDGASRFERIRYVVIPHLMPLIYFVTLIHLMDTYRVFEEIIGFASQAHVISLQWLTYNFLEPDDTGNRAISSASASSMLTMVGIIILLAPVLKRTLRDQKKG